MEFDLVIIGSGPGGYKAAITAAHLGAKVALVERGLPGGVCLNQGCIPKKTLLHLASLIEDVNGLQGRGLIGHVRGDFVAAMAHKDEVVAGIRNNFTVWLKRLGVQVFIGEGRLLGADRVSVVPVRQPVPMEFNAPFTDKEKLTVTAPLELKARRIIIATGSVPKELESCRTNGREIMNSQDFMYRLDHLPQSILCVGGGAIGAELGFLLHQLGSRVCIVEQGGRLLDQAHISERASAVLERKLTRIGVEVRKNASVAESRIVDGGVEVTYTDGRLDTYEHVLVAVGRRPMTAGLGLEQAGVSLNPDGFIEVTEYLESSVSGIYAIGDVKPGPMTANAALHDAKVAAANAINGNCLSGNYHKVPVVIHSALEVAAVGLTEDIAEQAGFDADVARSNLGGSGQARAHHAHEGFIEVVHDAETGQLLGGCIVGPEAGEQIHMMAAACQSERGLWFFSDMSYSHPSWCEELETAIDPYTSAFSKSGKEVFRPGIFASRQK
jgi:dihydrolipoamide dehydrogenase